MTARALLCCLAACIPLAAGCGDDQGASQGSAPSQPASDGQERGAELSPSAYRRRANGICREAKRWSKRAEARLDAGLAKDPVAALERVLSAMRRFDDRYARLAPPAALAREHAASVRESRQAEDAFAGLVEDFRAGQITRQSYDAFVRELEPLYESGNRRARRMGLDDCVQEGPLFGPDGAARS